MILLVHSIDILLITKFLLLVIVFILRTRSLPIDSHELITIVYSIAGAYGPVGVKAGISTRESVSWRKLIKLHYGQRDQ